MKRISDMPPNAARRRDLTRDRDGNIAIEMALLAVPLFVFVFGIINTGYALWLQNALESSVTQAARCATVNPTLCGTASQIQAYAAARSGAGLNSSIFSFTQPSCGNQVSATYPLPLRLPFMSSFSLSLNARACYPI
jgi:Flp pilus assembly protein TadG